MGVFFAIGSVCLFAKLVFVSFFGRKRFYM